MIKQICDTILPGDSVLDMPPASALDLEAYFIRHGVTEMTASFVEVVSDTARRKFDKDFKNLDGVQRLAAINGCKVVDIRLFSSFITHVLRAYYTDRSVLDRVSAGAVPPFPGGNELDADDWTILEPVYERGTIYRDASST